MDYLWRCEYEVSIKNSIVITKGAVIIFQLKGKEEGAVTGIQKGRLV